MADEATGDGQPGIERAYVSADSGIAAPVGGATTAPDQIYVEFSAPVVVEGAGGSAVPADGFAIDGTIAGVETVEQGAVAGDPEGSGSRVLVLTLSTGIAADEHPTLSYRPTPGGVQTPSGVEPAGVTDLDVMPGSPRVIDVSVLANHGDAVRVQFDRPVTTRTEDATMFSLADANGNSLLDGDIFVDGTRVVLPLTRDVTPDLGDGKTFTLTYREGGSDTERMHNLASAEGTLVQRFSQALQFEVGIDGFEIVEASVPRTPNGSGNIDRTRVQLWFAPSMSADSAAGYELRHSLATVSGLGSADADDPGSPDVTLDLDSPIDPSESEPAEVHYDPARGDTTAASDEAPSEPLSAPIETVAGPPTPRSAQLAADGEAITVTFDRPVRSQFGDATGLKLSGTGGVELSGRVKEGDRLTLGLTEPLDFAELGNTPKLTYATQGNSGPRYNLLGADDGMPAQGFTLEVERPDDSPSVEHVKIPQGSRDRVVVRFDRPVSADSAAGFSLDGPVARVESLASVDDMADAMKQYTVVLGLHVPVSTDSATLVYDADTGTVSGEDGGSPESFETDVEMLPPAPQLQRAVAAAGESAIRVEFDRPVTLNRGDANGFDLAYEKDRDDLPTLTGRVDVNGSTVGLETEAPVDLTAEPILDYHPDDEGPNVLGAEEGVAVAATTVDVTEAEGESESGEGSMPGEGTDAPDKGDKGSDAPDEGDEGSDAPEDDRTVDDGVPTLVEAEIPDTEPDHVICTFDTPVEADADHFAVDDVDARVVGTVDTGGEAELTLELTDPVPAGETLTVIYDPAG